MCNVTLSLTDDPARSATERAVALAKGHGLLVSVDPNLRKPLWSSEEKARRAMEWALEQADVVKLSDEEIDFLWGLTPEEGAQKLLDEYGVSLVYATRGPKGCHVANQHGTADVASPSGIRVVDTTGAGDIFGGTALAAPAGNAIQDSAMIIASINASEHLNSFFIIILLFNLMFSILSFAGRNHVFRHYQANEQA